ncbi:hypothetical protein MSG28_004244 [Choristoneura fumiferana]|uniref:Uncharacterized protein n=1 Tax=Choristoneura fumiferana TaxID=7141 RepID=A0ACC0KIT4_CHOFU|nr:hypothetical protein MSG28_004244 [Choristoneura fumiferana]
MEPHGRRSRNRRRCYSESFPSPSEQEEQPRGGFSILGSIQSIFIMASLIALIYMMLEYHCQTCKENCDLKKISKSIDDVVKNLYTMQEKYRVLESKVQVFSQELPKIEGQIQTLEALAKLVENGEFRWIYNHNSPLPRVKLYLSSSGPIRNNFPNMKNSNKSMNCINSVRA